MPKPSPSRRAVLRTGVSLGGLAALGSLAGCTSVLNDESGSSKLDAVPDGATTVVYADVAGFVSDEDVEASINEQLSAVSSSVPGSPETVSDALDEIESATGLDPRELNDVVLFGSLSDGGSGGAIVWSDWSERALTDAAAERGSELESDSYGDATVYHFQAGDSSIGVLGDGTYAIGTEAAVENAIDVASGDADPVRGTVRSAYEQSRSGYIRFGFEVTSEMVPDDPGGGIDASLIESIQSGYGSLTGGSDTAFSLTLDTADADSAENLADVITGGLARFKTEMEGQSPVGEGGEQLADTVVTLIENTEATADGSTVTVATTGNVGDITTIAVAIVASFVLGLGGQSAPRIPQAAFSFEYDQSAGIVEITHTGGDTITAANLRVTGSGFADASGADMTGPGQWQGTTSSDSGGEPAVAAGDSVTVGVTADCDLRLVYQAENTAATLAAYQGPDA